MSECRIRKKRSRIAAWGITFLLPLLLVFYSWFMEHRPRLHDSKEWNLQDTLIQNSDLLMAAVFLVLSLLPFYLMFDRRKAQARDLVPIALMAAMCVVGRTAFSIVPLPNFKPVTAIVMITGIAFGPEAGYLTGALAALLSNFLFGQGPWTPWQMFCWGLLGFLAGLAFNRATVEKLKSRDFKVVMGPLLCVVFAVLTAYLLYLLFPPVDNGSFLGWRLYVFGAIGLLLGVLVQRKRLPVDDITLTVFTFFTTFIIYGGLMNICAMVTAASIPGGNEISWDTMKLLYISGVPYDAAHAGSAAIFNFIFGDKIIRKLERIKLKYGIYR